MTLGREGLDRIDVQNAPVNFIDPDGQFIQGLITVGTLATLGYFIYEAHETQEKIDQLSEDRNDLNNEFDNGLRDPEKAEEIHRKCRSQEEEIRQEDFPDLVRRGNGIVEPASNLPSIPMPRDKK